MSFLHADVGHQDVIISLAFSPDGGRLLSGGWDGTAKLWDVQTGELLNTFSWGGSHVYAVAWSPDGATIAVAGWPPDESLSESELESYQAYFDHRDRSYFDSWKEDAGRPTEEVRLFDSTSGKLIRTISDHGSGVAFSPDGRSLAVASWSTLSIYERTSGECTSQFDGIENCTLRNLFFSLDSKQVASVDDNGVMVFDAETATPSYIATDKCLFSDAYEIDKAFRVAYLPNPADQLDSQNEAAYLIQFWQGMLAGFRPNNSSDGGMNNQRIALSPDGKLAAIHRDGGFSYQPAYASTLGGVSLFDLADGERVRFLATPDQESLRTTAFSPDGKLLAGAGDQQTIFLWDVESGTEILRIGQPPSAITAVSFSESRPEVAAGAADGTVMVCNTNTYSVLGINRLCHTEIAHVEFVNGTETLLVASRDGRVWVCSLPALTPIVEFQLHKNRLAGGMITADNKRFVSVGYDVEPSPPNGDNPAKIVLTQLKDGQELTSGYLPDFNRITSVWASPKENRLAITDGELILEAKITDKIRIQKLVQRKKAKFEISNVAFVPGSQDLLTANEGYGMTLLDLERSKPHRSFVATRDGPTSLALTQDGNWLIRSTAFFREIELFELSTGILKRYFVGHQASVNCLAISPDDRRLASGGKDGTLKLWDVETGELRASIVTLSNTSNSDQRWQSLTS